jgi:hypothetical protein
MKSVSGKALVFMCLEGGMSWVCLEVAECFLQLTEDASLLSVVA